MADMIHCNFRLPTDIVTQIDELIECGDFGDRSEFIRYAIRKTLMVYGGRCQTPSSKIEVMRG